MSLAGTMRYFIGLATDQLLPHQCLLCGRFCFDRGVCAACWDGAWLISAQLCHRCGRPSAHALPDHLCGQCWLAPPPLAVIRAGFVYNDFSHALILPFKHGDALHLTPVLGRFVTRHFNAMNDPGSLVIPIPLHRRHHNKRQAGLSRAQRKKNVAGIFSVTHKYRDILSGRPVILVDDVMASGATLAAAARCLLAAGSGPVKGLVVARVL